MSAAADHGVRYLLDRCDGEGGASWTYRGELRLGGGAVPVRIDVHPAPDRTDGIVTAVQVTSTPTWEVLTAEQRASLERTAAGLVKVAVRRANRDALPPPRRIHRWRGHEA